MSEWLAMGGHGVYVWSAYAVSAAALLGMGVWPWLALRRARGRIAATLGRERCFIGRIQRASQGRAPAFRGRAAGFEPRRHAA